MTQLSLNSDEGLGLVVVLRHVCTLTDKPELSVL